jgi:hypothetical protein
MICSPLGQNTMRCLRGGVLATAVVVVTTGMTAAASVTPSATCTPVDVQATLLSGPVDWTVNPGFTSPAGYGVDTTGPYWSVVATRGSQGGDPDLSLYSAPDTCALLGSDHHSGGIAADWVAFDNNAGRLPIGHFVTQVYDHQPYNGVTKHVTQFVTGDHVLSTTDGNADQSVGYGASDGAANAWIVDIKDVFLTAGTLYTFTVDGGLDNVFLLQSSTTDASTWRRTSATAVASAAVPRIDLDHSGHGTLEYRPTVTDYYGVLFVRNAWWGPEATVRISAHT